MLGWETEAQSNTGWHALGRKARPGESHQRHLPESGVMTAVPTLLTRGGDAREGEETGQGAPPAEVQSRSDEPLYSRGPVGAPPRQCYAGEQGCPAPASLGSCTPALSLQPEGTPTSPGGESGPSSPRALSTPHGASEGLGDKARPDSPPGPGQRPVTLAKAARPRAPDQGCPWA